MDLEKIAPLFEKYFKEALEEKRYPYGLPTRKGLSDKIASGDLYKSINAVAGPDFIGIEMNFYSKFQQKGRAVGLKGVPIYALVKWIKDRGIKPRPKQTVRSLAFAIQKTIKRFGFRASNIYDIALDKMVEDPMLEELLGQATFEDLINQIEGI